MNTLKDLTTRECQAYGALCLHQFCKAKNIKHAYIDELIEHLLAFLTTMPLDAWEREGADLALNGRGEPLPSGLETQLAEDVRDDFFRLVFYVVQIGVCDMYGAETMEPLNNLLRCLEILDAHGITRPDLTEIFKGETPREEDVPELGEKFSQERYEQVKTLFH